MVNCQEIAEAPENCVIHMKSTDIVIDSIKIFIWDSFDRMQPLSDVMVFTNQSDMR